MKASNASIDNFIGQNSSFVIPVYQRNYAWREEQCRRLLDDAIALTKDSEKRHFVGSVCIKHRWEGNRESVIVIDGQQRLTTLSLLFLAMAKTARKLDTQISKNLSATVLNSFIFLSSFTGERVPKLRLNIRDNDDYLKIIGNIDTNDEIAGDSHIIKNFSLFEEWLSEMSDAKLADLASCLHRLEIAVIELSDSEDAQEIFDSINSTGLELTDVDRIRNFLLMDLHPDTQERLYTDYWNETERLIGLDSMSDFLCSYLVSYGSRYIYGVKCSEKTLYQAFKSWYGHIPTSWYGSGSDDKAEYVLSSIYDSASSYSDLISSLPVTPDRIDSSKDVYWMIKTVGKHHFMVVAIYLLRLRDSGTISSETMASLFKILFSYFIRNRIVPGKTSFSYQTSGNIILRLESATSQYDEIGERDACDAMYNAVFLQNGGNSKMATDSEFRAAIKTAPIYLTNKELVHFLLYAIELSDREARKTIPDFDAASTVEHIMPQHPTQEWLDEFGSGPDENIINEFGNLTLTNLNSELSNKSFSEKKTKYLKDSFPMTRALCTNGSWTYDDVVSRGDAISKKLISLFPLPDRYSSEEYIEAFKQQVADKSSRSTFKKLGLPVGTVLHFRQDYNVTCTIANPINQVEYNGKTYAISAVVKVIQEDRGETVRSSYNGFDWFMYDGIKLTERRRRIESGEIDIAGVSDI